MIITRNVQFSFQSLNLRFGYVWGKFCPRLLWRLNWRWEDSTAVTDPSAPLAACPTHAPSHGTDRQQVTQGWEGGTNFTHSPPVIHLTGIYWAPPMGQTIPCIENLGVDQTVVAFSSEDSNQHLSGRDLHRGYQTWKHTGELISLTGLTQIESWSEKTRQRWAATSVRTRTMWNHWWM